MPDEPAGVGRGAGGLAGVRRFATFVLHLPALFRTPNAVGTRPSFMRPVQLVSGRALAIITQGNILIIARLIHSKMLFASMLSIRFAGLLCLMTYKLSTKNTILRQVY
jgi:hypothetical protein